MRTSLHDVWGSATGPVTRLAPETRLVCGAGLFAACLVAPAATSAGSLAVIAMTIAWLAACRPPRRVARNTAVLGLAVLLPYFLLLPLIPSSPAPGPQSWSRALAVPWSILLRGMSGMLVSVATATTLGGNDLHEALVRLPVPAMVSAILLQIVHQTATLVDETRHVAAAMAVRGASSGPLTAWRLLSSVSQVWLPRLFVRAERVAAAMELRGYLDRALRPLRRTDRSLADAAVMISVLGLLVLAVLLRVRLAS
jgi:energy-coupling factor transporter transmembrane protein EcfT